MADLLRITTPVVEKNQQLQPVKAGADPSAPFQMQDITKVVQPNAQSGILKQNTGLIQEGGNPTLLENLLKDPSVTASYLKNIFMLEEIIKLLPANNRAVTDEIESMFSLLLVDPKDVASEMQSQGRGSTAFQGPIFDFLRAVSNRNPPGTDIQFAIAHFLRALNHVTGNRDIRDAVANGLQFLFEDLGASKTLGPQLQSLVERFRAPDAEKNFVLLKKETLNLLKDVRDSILFTPRLEKIVSITIYNLSRHSVNPNFLQETVMNLSRLLGGADRGALRQLLTEYLESVQQNAKTPQVLQLAAQAADDPLDEELVKAREERASKVMETLTKLVSIQAKAGLSLTEQGQIERILHSLLSSPCNFTPLLHFIVPVAYEDTSAFAEMWIDPNVGGDSDDSEKRGVHMLLVIDMESAGRFEAEIATQGNRLDFSLFCPDGYESAYKDFGKTVQSVLANTSYKMGKVRVETLHHNRSLMEVFKSLPYRRTGVDVKI